MFNNSSTIGVNIIKPPQCTLHIEGFPTIPKA